MLLTRYSFYHTSCYFHNSLTVSYSLFQKSYNHVLQCHTFADNPLTKYKQLKISVMYQGNCILHITYITYRSKRYIIHTANLQHNYTDCPQKMIIELSTTSITSFVYCVSFLSKC